MHEEFDLNAAGIDIEICRGTEDGPVWRLDQPRWSPGIYDPADVADAAINGDAGIGGSTTIFVDEVWRYETAK